MLKKFLNRCSQDEKDLIHFEEEAISQSSELGDNKLTEYFQKSLEMHKDSIKRRNIGKLGALLIFLALITSPFGIILDNDFYKTICITMTSIFCSVGLFLVVNQIRIIHDRKIEILIYLAFGFLTLVFITDSVKAWVAYLN